MVFDDRQQIPWRPWAQPEGKLQPLPGLRWPLVSLCLCIHVSCNVCNIIISAMCAFTHLCAFTIHMGMQACICACMCVCVFPF